MSNLKAAELNLRFKRNDIYATSTTSRGCLRVIPQSKRGRQKVVVGDQTGVVTCFNLGKHHDIQVNFQTVAAQGQKPISAICLYVDQIFAASGERINAYTKKGRPFFGLETNLSEKINFLCVDTPFLFTGGDYVMTGFRESTERGFYMNPDRMNDLAMAKTESDEVIDVFIAGQDRVLRSLRDIKVTQEVPCESPLMSVAVAQIMKKDVVKGQDIVYGTLTGSLGGLKINKDGTLTSKFNAIPEGRLGGITALTTRDVTLDGTHDVVLGRDDGIVEVHSLEGNVDGTAVQAWRGTVSECVNSIGAGHITHGDNEELIVSTYSGKIITFSVTDDDSAMHSLAPSILQNAQQKVDHAAAVKELQSQGQSNPNAENAPAMEVLQSKIHETEAEIKHLKDQLKQKRQEFATSTGLQAKQIARAISSQFHVRHVFSLDDNATLTLRIQTDFPLHCIALQCDTELEVLETPETQQQAIVSINGEMTNYGKKNLQLQANIRAIEENCQLMDIRFRSIEGQYGKLHAFVICKLEPRTAQMLTFVIRPLSLHQRVSDSNVDPDTLPLSQLRIQGNFSAKDAHSWIYNCLPDVPELLQSEEGKLVFRNTFQNTILICRYHKGEAEFLSENLSTLAVMKEAVTKEATARKIAVRMNSDFKQESVVRTLELLHSHIQHQTRLTQRMRILDGLKEIEMQEEDKTFLSDEYKSILQDAGDMERDLKQQPKRLEYIRRLLEKLLVDKALFKSETTPQSKIDQLGHILDNYSDKAIQDFFL